jgi:DNA-binding NarL/FixJ family response regulator
MPAFTSENQTGKAMSDRLNYSGSGEQALRTEGRTTVPRLGAHRAARTANTGGLSRRELEIARLVATGLTNRAIAERLFLAERTVESHVDHILNKLDFRSRAQLAAWISEQRLGEVSAQP